MAEYIESICRRCFHAYVCEQFNEHRDGDNQKCHFFNDHFVSAADVVEVKRGRWIGAHDGWFYSYSCSECGAEALTKEETMHDQVCSPFCPYCGADMRSEGNNENQ